jgi:nuclease S1
MANESLVTSNTPAVNAQELLNTAFSKLKELGAGEESSHLFPGGIGSVDLAVDSGNEPDGGFHLALRISAVPPVTPVSLVPTLTIAGEDDAEVTFNTEGHHVIALIASLDLQARRPAVFERVQQILAAGDRELTEAATFPDDIRNSQPETKPFHFIDIPFRDDGPVNPPLPAAPHVISKIKEFSDFFLNGGGSDQENVDALSWLIHMFGDTHQPLHCIEHISSLHPGGDRGGNSFKLRGRARNLHSAWDSSVNVSAPRDEEELAHEIAQQHTRATLASDLQTTNTEKWARASFKLAKKFAYSIAENPADPPTLTAAYRKNMEKVGRRQAALAGYRLADRLEAILH